MIGGKLLATPGNITLPFYPNISLHFHVMDIYSTYGPTKSGDLQEFPA